jgi:uncharacterized membrane protein
MLTIVSPLNLAQIYAFEKFLHVLRILSSITQMLYLVGIYVCQAHHILYDSDVDIKPVSYNVQPT